MKLPILISLLTASLSGFLSLIQYPLLPPMIPLFYTLSQLDEQLTQKEFIFLIPAISLIIFTTHIVFGKILSKTDLVMMQLLSWTTVLLNFLLLFSLIRILIIL